MVGRKFEFLLADAHARQIEQVGQQADHARDFLLHGLIQLAFARTFGEVEFFAEQAQAHADARDRRAQFVRGAHHEFAAHLVEGVLHGDVAQHHHHADAIALAFDEAMQRIGDDALFAIVLDAQFRTADVDEFAAGEHLADVARDAFVADRLETFADGWRRARRRAGVRPPN